MKTTLRRWASLGLGTAFLGTGVASCASDSQELSSADISQLSAETEAATDAYERGERGEGERGESGEGERGEGERGESGEGERGESGEGEGGEGEGGEGEGGEAGHDVGALPLPQRLAFMTGHFNTGLALYRAGEPAMAAPHLLHPVSETHEAERAGLDALGFDASLFEAVSKALEDGLPASEIEPQLAAAEENLAMVAAKAGGEPTEIIRFLMDTIVEEYTIAINDGVVTDPGEYQDAFGFAIAAKGQAQRMDPSVQPVIDEINALIAFWPEAPIPPETPTPVGQIIAQTSKVVLALPAN